MCKFSQWSLPGVLVVTLFGCVTAIPTPELTAEPPAAITIPVQPTETAPEAASVPAVQSSPLPTPLPQTQRPQGELVQGGANKLGLHLLLEDGRNHWPTVAWPGFLILARQAVGEWGYVTQVIHSNDLNRDKWQQFMDLCAELHLTPILRLATDFDKQHGWWKKPNPDPFSGYRKIGERYARFIDDLKWPTDEHLILVGNEPNHGGEWGGTPNPASYARFLIDVADSIHEADSKARVMNAGFDPYSPNSNGQPLADGMVYLDEETFLDEMVAAYPDVFSHIDGWVSHSYPMGPFTAGPWEQSYGVDLLYGATNPAHVEPPPGLYNRGINGYEWELWKLSTYGVEGLPVFITETGWRHAETVNPASTDTGENLPSAQTIADYVDLSLQGNGGRYPQYPEEGWTPWLADPRVRAVTFFAMNGDPSEWGHTNWLELTETAEILSMYPMMGVLEQIP